MQNPMTADFGKFAKEQNELFVITVHWLRRDFVFVCWHGLLPFSCAYFIFEGLGQK